MAPPPRTQPVGAAQLANPMPVGECRSRGEAARRGQPYVTGPQEALQQGEPVILRRFGTWQVRAKRARVGRNPKTGAAAAIPARRVVRFVVSQTLKQAVAGVASPAD